MQEIWKDIYFVDKGITYDYRGRYQVSNFGRIKSLNFNRTNEEKILKPMKDKKGYLYIGLSKNDIRKYFKIHRIVAIMFIPNPENKPQVNHKSGAKTDNRACNLEWCTQSENQRHAYKTGLQIYKNIYRDKYGRFIRYKDAN